MPVTALLENSASAGLALWYIHEDLAGLQETHLLHIHRNPFRSVLGLLLKLKRNLSLMV